MSLTQDDESDEELPSLPFLLHTISPRKKQNESVKVLLDENADLLVKIQETERNKKFFSEKLKKIENMNINNEENVPEEHSESSVTPDINENLPCKHFCQLNFLQFINRDDLALQKCGYDRFSSELLSFEKIMVSMEPIHLETLLSSIFSDRLSFAVKEVKSFVTYLLRVISTSSEKQCINACVNALEFILQADLSMEDFSFGFIDFFCPLLFNYGVDVSNCPFVEIKRQFEKRNRCKDKHNSRMPDTFEYNLASLLHVLDLCIRLGLQNKDFKDIILVLIWLGIDQIVYNEAIFENFQNCLCSILLQFEEVTSQHNLKVEVAEAILSMQCSNVNKWKYICKMTKVIPYAVKEGRDIRQFISFNALRAMTQSITNSEEQGLREFSLTELQSIMACLCEIEPDNITVAVTFIDLCLNQIRLTSETEFESLCQALRECEVPFSKKYLPAALTYQEWARFHLQLIYSRVKIMFTRQPFSQISATLKKEPQSFDDIDRQVLPNISTLELRPVIKEESCSSILDCMLAKESTSMDFSTHLPDVNFFVPPSEKVFTSISNEGQNIASAPVAVTKIKTEYPDETVSGIPNLAALPVGCCGIESDSSIVVKKGMHSLSEIGENQRVDFHINVNVSEDVGIVISETYSECITENSRSTECRPLGNLGEDVPQRSDTNLGDLKIIEFGSLASSIKDTFNAFPNELNSEFNSEILKVTQALCSEIEMLQENQCCADRISESVFCNDKNSDNDLKLSPNVHKTEIMDKVNEFRSIIPENSFGINSSESLTAVTLGNIYSSLSENFEHDVCKSECKKLEIADITSKIARPNKILSGGLFQPHAVEYVSSVSPLSGEYEGDSIPLEEIKYEYYEKEDKIPRHNDILKQCSDVEVVKSLENASEISPFDISDTELKVKQELSSNDFDDLIILDTVSRPSSSNNKRKFTSNNNSSKKLKKTKTLGAEPFVQHSGKESNFSSSDSEIEIVWSCVHKNSPDCIITEVKPAINEIILD